MYALSRSLLLALLPCLFFLPQSLVTCPWQFVYSLPMSVCSSGGLTSLVSPPGLPSLCWACNNEQLGSIACLSKFWFTGHIDILSHTLFFFFLNKKILDMVLLARRYIHCCVTIFLVKAGTNNIVDIYVPQNPIITNFFNFLSNIFYILVLPALFFKGMD